jgi:hypothetical protein
MSLQDDLDALRAEFVRSAPPDRRIRLAEIELDYRERLEPDAIITALRAYAPLRPRPPKYDRLTERNRQ